MKTLIFIVWATWAHCVELDNEEPNYNPDYVMAEGEGLIDMNREMDWNHASFPEMDRSAPAPFYQEAYDKLTEGLTYIDCTKHYPSEIYAFGPNSFSITTSISGAFYGKGKVMVFGRSEWVIGGVDSMTKFKVNAAKWMSGKDNVTAIKAASWPNSGIKGLPNVQRKFHPSQLSSNPPDVYFVDAKTKLEEPEVEQILKYVENGGGLFYGGQAWYWSSNDPKVGRANGFPGNKVLTKMGIMIGNFDWHRKKVPTKPVPPPETNLYHAFKAIKEGKGNLTVALNTIMSYPRKLMDDITRNMPEFQELFSYGMIVYNALDTTTINGRKAYSGLTQSLLPVMLANGSVPRASDVANFPYETPADAEVVTKTMSVNGTYEGYPNGFSFAQPGKDLIVSTGLYAPPGAILTVTVDQSILDKIGSGKQIGVQIGCHSDQLYSKDSPKRSPQITFKFKIVSVATKVANPWGGLVYINIPWGVDYGDFDVTINGGINAPYYVYGKTSLEDWTNTIRKYPAPWGELELPGQFIISLPSSVLRDFDNPKEFLEEYQNVFEAINYLAGFENNYKYRAERFTLDIQISGGWMHSGYPMMGFISYAKKMIDVSNLRKGNVWGVFHEIGHNLQYSSYTIGRTAEAGCNVWAQYANFKVFGVWKERGHQSTMDSSITNYIMNGKPFNNDYSVNLALQSYFIFLNEYGWDQWPLLMKRYYAIPRIGGGDDNKLDMFARMTCQQVETNVAPYWAWWGYKLTDETITTCQSFPNMTKNLVARYEGVDYSKVVDHRNCTDGWLPFGNSCFFLSTQKVMWHDAEDKCISAGEDSHLASCLSSQEAHWLKNLITSNSYFVGIDTLNEDRKPRFLDGSNVTETSIIPWVKGSPSKDLRYQCAVFLKDGVKSERCHSNQNFICKSGPTSCGAKWTCPDGWLRRHDTCYWVKYGYGSYQDAESDCTAKGAKLLEIDSKEENDWIVELQKDIRWRGQYYWRSYWLGMNDTSTGKWNSGEEVYYQGAWCDGIVPGERGDGFRGMMKSNDYCWHEKSKTSRDKEAWICKQDATIKF